jgi:hypothetical protein
VDIKNKWVHFDDTLELEVFLNVCEDHNIYWIIDDTHFTARSFLEEELNDYKIDTNKVSFYFRCGYYTDGHNMHDVYFDSGAFRFGNTMLSSEDRFSLL